ncbi:cytochrome P450 family protein [Dactylosporangium darangshiense]|uniref:Cytochrome P450 n=1 Tax=Dactylosporangium darangshiense TaxID=579108 RepID=A0ABP8DCE5_9ACTN
MPFDPFLQLSASVPAERWRALLDAGGWVGFDDDLGLWVIVGADAVGQACCDPTTFADITTVVPVEPIADFTAPLYGRYLPPSIAGSGVPPQHAGAQAALRLVWPSGRAQAHTAWARRLSPHVRRHVEQAMARPELAGPFADDLGPRLTLAMLDDLFGLSTGHFARLVPPRVALLGPDSDAPDPRPAIRAARSLAYLRRYIHAVVRRRAAEPPDPYNPGQPDNVIDDLLVVRNGRDDLLALNEIAVLASSLFSTAWDAASWLLPAVLAAVHRGGSAGLDADLDASLRLVSDALDRPAAPVGWLRHTTQAVLLEHTRLPAGADVLLLVDPADLDPATIRPQLAHQLQFTADAPDGFGRAFAVLVADLVLTDIARRPPRPAGAGVAG